MLYNTMVAMNDLEDFIILKCGIKDAEDNDVKE